jgi:hypothetical protein
MMMVGVLIGVAPPPPSEAAACTPDAVPSGSLCIDRYEASVWEIPLVLTNRRLIRLVKLGRATLAALTSPTAIANGVVQRGLAANDLFVAGCQDNGNNCITVYAASIPGVLPSRFLTWFQAAAAARNAGKRLPTNAEWQAAALGTPNGAPCNVGAGFPGPTGTAGCVSDMEAFDMVGNLWEWVADWVPLSTGCVSALFAGDDNCLVGASVDAGPGALIRGGYFSGGFTSASGAGVYAVNGVNTPSVADSTIGFRAAR